ncbi:hypothetical protein BD289DRAFT_86814 [Coniella lustricola]|uniref:Uncharacterized protein n=1 Tax=Coniella lustricola TaxID=2025994 RepID=A0A2T2ZYV5_9PEZI|nr:hypothetical protein BD289DRAFT_86814 [Coniella lustricola]
MVVRQMVMVIVVVVEGGGGGGGGRFHASPLDDLARRPIPLVSEWPARADLRNEDPCPVCLLDGPDPDACSGPGSGSGPSPILPQPRFLCFGLGLSQVPISSTRSSHHLLPVESDSPVFAFIVVLARLLAGLFGCLYCLDWIHSWWLGYRGTKVYGLVLDCAPRGARLTEEREKKGTIIDRCTMRVCGWVCNSKHEHLSI